jgi:MYXO-CTERM domain-containing protein
VGACGNAKLEAGEGCDDGNKADNDGCSASCRVEPGKPCNGDVAGNTGNSSCSTDLCNTSSGQPGTCVVTLSCGNGVKEAGEGCDDGNLKASDGCSALCKIEDTFPCESTASSSCQSGYCGGNNTCQPAGGGSIEGGACATTEDSSTPVGLFGSIGLALAALFGRRKARTA